jgi:endoglucanase
VILDNHRSKAGNSAESNGLWYATTGGKSYPESSWIADWQTVQKWVYGMKQTQGSTDTITVNYLSSDGFPIVFGYDLCNEPHTPRKRRTFREPPEAPAMASALRLIRIPIPSRRPA